MCVAPLTIVNPKTSQRQKVACGRCYECISSRRGEWATRMQLEMEYNPPAVFVTLTYDDDHCDGALHYKEHIVPFIRNLRRHCKLRYVMVGEYGSHTHRPHYHMVTFGVMPSQVADLVDRYWPYGLYKMGELQYGGAMYVAKYHVLSKINKLPFWDPEFQEYTENLKSASITFDDLIEDEDYCHPDTLPDEFFHTSRRPGIGAPYMTPDNVHAHRSRPTPYVTANDKVTYMPKYLKNKIYDDAMRADIHDKMAEAALKRAIEAAKHLGIDFDEFFDSEYQRLRRKQDKHKRNKFKEKKDGTF